MQIKQILLRIKAQLSPHPKYSTNFKGATTAKGHTEGSEQPRSKLHTHRQSREVHTVNKQFCGVWERAKHYDTISLPINLPLGVSYLCRGLCRGSVGVSPLGERVGRPLVKEVRGGKVVVRPGEASPVPLDPELSGLAP